VGRWVLAILAVISGKLMNVQEMIEGSVKETPLCRTIDRISRIATAGGVPEGKGHGADAAEVTRLHAGAAEHAPDVWQFHRRRRRTRRHHMSKCPRGGAHAGIWGAMVYWRGLSVCQRDAAVPPVRWFAWHNGRMLLRRVGFYVFGDFVMALSWLRMFDRFVVDGSSTAPRHGPQMRCSGLAR